MRLRDHIVWRAKCYLVALAILNLVVVVHELGHFAAARWYNVHCIQLSVGFGPGIELGHLGQTSVHVRSIPLGGYVELAASEEDLPGESTTNAHYIDEVSTFGKVVIYGAGIASNILLLLGAVYLRSMHLDRRMSHSQRREETFWIQAFEESEFRSSFWKFFSDGPVKVIFWMTRGPATGVTRVVWQTEALCFSLILLNLVPIAPLDGEKIFGAIFSSQTAAEKIAGGPSIGTLLSLSMLLLYFAIGLVPSIFQLFKFERILYRLRSQKELR